MIGYLLSFVFALEIVVLIDFCLVLLGRHFKLSLYGISFVALFLFFATSGRMDGIPGGISIAVFPMIIVVLYLIWCSFARHVWEFSVVDNGKKELYAGKRIMAIVPHQDDEINILGGVFEEYVKYGSEVFLVYVMTNGQTQGFRYEEALALCRHIGIPDDHVAFLGYAFRNKHINDPHRTKGTNQKAAYHEGQEYSRENMVNDIYQIIVEQKPDIIFGSDYDYHIDHHLVCICIDEAVGKLLKKEKQYRPSLVKCYAYRTAWESYPDYYKGDNLRSTLYMPAPVEIYRWEERLRFPVTAKLLCRSLLKSEAYRQYAVFKSQSAVMRAINTNTDKVGWERRTDSILLDAVITTTSGDSSKLNDFLLYDKQDMAALDEIPLSGAWITEEWDLEQTATFSLKTPRDICYVDIYNNPSKENRVNKVRITFSGGTTYDVEMDPLFVRTRVFVNQHGVSHFSISILEKSCEQAGITEVEAFEDCAIPAFSFVKVVNGDNDFVYDYWVNRSGMERLSLYTQGNAVPSFNGNYMVNVSNGKCKTEVANHDICITCPQGESTQLTVSSMDGQYADTVLVSNPRLWLRVLSRVGRRIEAIYYDIFKGDQHRKATSISVWAYIKNKIGSGMDKTKFTT